MYWQTLAAERGLCLENKFKYSNYPNLPFATPTFLMVRLSENCIAEPRRRSSNGNNGPVSNASFLDLAFQLRLSKRRSPVEAKESLSIDNYETKHTHDDVDDGGDSFAQRTTVPGLWLTLTSSLLLGKYKLICVCVFWNIPRAVNHWWGYKVSLLD